MQIIRMSQVENVVDQQFVVTVGRQITPDGGIGRRVREFTVVRNQTLVCQGRGSCPPPQQPMPLDCRVAIDPRRLGMLPLLCGLCTQAPVLSNRSPWYGHWRLAPPSQSRPFERGANRCGQRSASAATAPSALRKRQWRVEQRPRQQSTSIDLVDETGHVPRIAQVHELSSGAQLRMALPASAEVRSAARIAPAPRVRPPALASPLPRSAVSPQQPLDPR